MSRRSAGKRYLEAISTLTTSNVNVSKPVKPVVPLVPTPEVDPRPSSTVVPVDSHAVLLDDPNGAVETAAETIETPVVVGAAPDNDEDDDLHEQGTY